MMSYLIVAGVVCVLGGVVVVACARSLIAAAMRRYPRVKAAVHVGRAGFTIEADEGGDLPAAVGDPARLGGRRAAR